MIPNFVGADVAAWRLAQTDAWKNAGTVKTTPMRRRSRSGCGRSMRARPSMRGALPHEGLSLSQTRPKETDGEGYLVLTCRRFARLCRIWRTDRVRGCRALDFCVVGSVAVSRAGGRTGKGAGFADLETAIFRELGTITDETPIVTTVSLASTGGRTRMSSYRTAFDSPLDMVATERELILTGNRERASGWRRLGSRAPGSIRHHSLSHRT